MEDTEPNAVQVDKTPDGITTVTLHRPHRRNAVDGPTAKKLTDAFLQFEDDPTQKVCVLYGAGGTFCAGFDLHEVAQFQPGATAATGYKGPILNPVVQQPQDLLVDGDQQQQQQQSRSRSSSLLLGPMGPTRLQIQKPVISAVAGHAVAGGLELALLGDLRVAEADAVFGVFCRRFGVPLVDGGTARLPAVVGLGRALDLVLTGRAVPADEALQMGLANRVVAPGRALAEATVLARQLLAFPQACMNADRASCYYAVYGASSFPDALRHEFDEGVKVITTESVQGAARFSAGAGRHGAFGMHQL